MPGRLSPETVLRRFFELRPQLEAIIMASARDYHLAEDVLQEVAIAIVRKSGEYDPARPFGPWVRAIARNQLAYLVRGRSTGAALLAPETLERISPAFDEACRDEDLEARRVALEGCMGEMRGVGRNVLNLRYHERQSCDQIASALGRTLQAVYAVLKRAKQILKECVEGRLTGRKGQEELR